MKKILKYIFTLLIIFIIFDNIAYPILKKVIFDKTFGGEAGGNINYLLKENKKSDFLIFGNSRAVHQINPALLKNFYNGNGFNAGVNGVQGINYIHILLDLIIKSGLKPKTIILQIDPIDFKRNDLVTQLNALSLFYGESKVMRQYVHELNWREEVLLNIKLYRFNNKLINVFFNYIKPSSLNRSGYLPLIGTIDTINKDIIEKQKISEHFLPTKIDALKSIYTICNEKSINMLVVLAPTYKNILYEEKSKLEFIKLTSTMPKLTVFDFSDVNVETEFDQAKYWKDKNHLNEEGATIFTNKLNSAIQNLNK